MVHTCTRCELRFPTEAELKEHLVVDHAADAGAFDRGRYPADRSSFRPLYADVPAEERERERRYLVVANQTLGGDALQEKIDALLASGGARFHVVVPTSPAPEQPADEAATAQARFRLRSAVDRLRAGGVEATGETVDADPFKAVGEVLRRDDFDEVILSTLPASASRWLGMDLPARIERTYGRPVTIVTPGSRAGS